MAVLHPEVQDPHSLSLASGKFFAIAIPDSRLPIPAAVHKLKLTRMEEISISGSWQAKGRIAGVTIFSCVFHKDFHTVAVMPFIIHKSLSRIRLVG